MAARRYELSDAQWEQIKDMIPRAKTGRPPKDDRLMLNAMLWLARSGAAWADIPERYGPHQSVYSRFCKWRDDGTLLRIFQALNARMLTMKTFVSTALPSRLIRKARGQKRGCKFGKQSVYWNKSRWKDYKNPYDCRRFGESSPLYAHRRAGT